MKSMYLQRVMATFGNVSLSVAACVSALCLTAFRADVAWGEPNVIAAGGNPRRASVMIDSSTDLQKPIYFYYVSQGNETKPVEVTLAGPGGATAIVEIAKIKGDPQQLAVSLPRKYRMQLGNPLRIAPSPTASFAEGMGSFPGGCTEEQYNLYLELIDATPELAGITPEQFCAGFGGGGNPPGGDNGGGGTGQVGNEVTQIGLLRKNACAGAKRSRYLVRMKVDLSAVDPATLQGGVELRGSFKERNYNGSRAASIKPRSDGRFAPAPLLLMSSVSSYGERLSVMRWKNNRPRKATPVRIEDYVYYRGLVLTRSVVTSLLNGKGKATFELTNGDRAYAVCFSMRRERQNRNGYPGGDGA